MSAIARHYAYAGERQIHCRRTGSGAPLVIIPPLPLSSSSIVTTINELARTRTVIAIDQPG